MREHTPERSTVRAAIYTRKSSEEGLDQEFNSLDAQREACAAFILSQRHEGWTLVDEHYDDGGYSGGNMERPGLVQLLADVRDGKIDVVVVYKVDRLSRSLSDFAKMVEILDDAKASFVSITQAFNTTTSMGRLTLNVLLSFAQFEREVTGERIRDKIAASKKKGMWMGGNIPLGFDVADRKLVTNIDDAATVVHIMQRYVALRSVRELAAELLRDGIHTKRKTYKNGKKVGGQPFCEGGLRALLKNRIYIGEVVHRGQHYPGEHQALVPQDLFDTVQAIMAGQSTDYKHGRLAEHPSLLSGWIYDGLDRPIYPSHAVKNGKRYRYYITHPKHVKVGDTSAWRLPAYDIEKLVTKQLADVLANTHEFTTALGSTISAEELQAHLNAAQTDATTLRTARDTTCRELIVKWISRIDIGTNSCRMTFALPTGVTIVKQAHIAKIRTGTDVRLHIVPSVNTDLPKRNEELIALIAEAHAARTSMLDNPKASIEDIASSQGIGFARFKRLIRLSFLAPSIIESILAGTQPADMTLASINTITNIPLCWDEQQAMLAAA